jgi:hypothetical protein
MNNAVAVTTASVGAPTTAGMPVPGVGKCGKICMNMKKNGVKWVSDVKIHY